MSELETQNPQDQSSQNNRNAGDAQLFKEEDLRGRINGNIVMPDQPSFSQPKALRAQNFMSPKLYEPTPRKAKQDAGVKLR